MSIRSLRRTAAALAAALCIATLVSAAPSTAAPAQDGPRYHRPSVGECRNLTVKQFLPESSPQQPVKCSSRHTALTLAVVNVPRAISWKHKAKLLQITVNACLPVRNRALGATGKLRDMSAYQLAWYLPTARERSHGARWLRCDLVMRAGARLAPLPTNGKLTLPNPLTNKVRSCITSSGTITTCTRKHHFRSAGAFVMRHKGFPTRRQFHAAATSKCPSLLGRHQTLGWVTWQLRAMWNAGDHLVVCYATTRR